MVSTLQGKAYFEGDSFPFFIQRYIIQKDETIPSHTHDFIELIYVVKGSALHEMAEQRYALATGDVFVIEPQTYHSYIGSDTEETIIYNVLFEKQLLQKELGGLLEIPAFIHFFYLAPFLRKNASFVPYISLTVEQRRQIESLLQKIDREFHEKPVGYQLIIKTSWIECLVLLSRYHEEHQNSSNHTLPKEDWMDSILHFVEQHHRQPLSLDQLSRTCGMSVSSFTAKFKKATGKSFIDYKHSLQIRHACDMLKDPHNKVIHIALSSGFQDISFFNRIFRKHMGMTPGQFRQQQTI
ncbi:AraC family transcriptional regulator [Paenibacillus abyssi]|uniref:HTH-type transcriptional activator RhaR n=1 Tax=Paenibacillus abyssi TaxID=1340531 RepID=A0A917G541_9BACL|nr:AraC family transcriptional regulator [Paenibacillus abyssi]GGG22711.1 HTH-type transcriptional activator RhaR [Paenibacillus abyssi]